MGIEFHVDIQGPIARGEALGIMHRYKIHLEQTLAERGQRMIRAYLPTQYMYLGNNGGNPRDNPIPPDAGRLQASVVTDFVADDYYLVKTDEVIVGPWIEGIAVGNTFVWPGRIRRGLSPRFPGYHAFRLATQVLNDVAFEVAERELPHYIAELSV